MLDREAPIIGRYDKLIILVLGFSMFPIKRSNYLADRIKLL